MKIPPRDKSAVVRVPGLGELLELGANFHLNG